jgi:hypothetical protein
MLVALRNINSIPIEVQGESNAVRNADRAGRIDSHCSPATCCDTISLGDGIPPLTAVGADDAYRMNVDHSVGVICTFSQLRSPAQPYYPADSPRGYFSFRTARLAAKTAAAATVSLLLNAASTPWVKHVLAP